MDHHGSKGGEGGKLQQKHPYAFRNTHMVNLHGPHHGSKGGEGRGVNCRRNTHMRLGYMK